MKFNCDKDQVQIVDSSADMVGVMRKITESGVSVKKHFSLTGLFYLNNGYFV